LDDASGTAAAGALSALAVSPNGLDDSPSSDSVSTGVAVGIGTDVDSNSGVTLTAGVSVGVGVGVSAGVDGAVPMVTLVPNQFALIVSASISVSFLVDSSDS